MKSISVTLVMLIIPCLILLALLIPPTSASEAIRTEIWLEQEYVAGSPSPGNVGSLFEQLILTIEARGEELFSGQLSSINEPLDLTSSIGIAADEAVELDFTIHLPGASTGNEFQGSKLSTKFTFLARATDGSGKPVAGTLEVDPQQALFELGNLNPGDIATGSLIVKYRTKPDLPVTSDHSQRRLYIWGLALVAAGIALGRLAMK